MVDNLQLNVVDAVALIGAHTVGRMRCPHSGFHGTWDSTPHIFDNGYFQRIALKGQMDQYEIDAPTPASKLTSKPERPAGARRHQLWHTGAAQGHVRRHPRLCWNQVL